MVADSDQTYLHQLYATWLGIATFYKSLSYRVIICLGSRSAPITLSFAQICPDLCRVVLDERSAAFQALGMAKATGKPSILICTSGTAGLNFAPAIAEAYLSAAPLIVITADRPASSIGQADNQTIFQYEMYGKHVKYFHNLPEDYGPHQLNYINRIISESNYLSMQGVAGPIHLNVPLREPLYIENIERVIPHSFIILNEYYFDINTKKLEIPEHKVLLLIGDVVNAKKIPLNESIPAILGVDFASLESIIPIISTFEQIPVAEFIEPEAIITIGKNYISKKLKNWLKGINRTRIDNNLAPITQYHFGQPEEVHNTFNAYLKLIDLNQIDEITLPLSAEGKIHPITQGYNEAWLRVNEKYLNDTSIGLDETWACISKILQYSHSLTAINNIHIGNSSLVRSFSKFLADIQPKAKVYSNRGTSGIDGSISTAVGQYYSRAKGCICIVGDQAALYDSNALLSAGKFFVLIIVNDGGGRIFEKVNTVSSQSILDTYFVNAHNYRFNHWAAHSQADYVAIQVDNYDDDMILAACEQNFNADDNKPLVIELIIKP